MTTPAQMKKNNNDLLAEIPSLKQKGLEALVRHHNAAYWDNHDPEIDDPTFDKLLEALRAVAPKSKVLDELGESVPDVADRRFQSATHIRPMLSLDKCYDDDTLQKWQDKIKGGFVVTPKMDGLACSIRYKADGTMELCATRGDGKKGDNITKNASQIKDIPTTVDVKKTGGIAFEVRGEVYMKISHFKKHYEGQFANPRNLAAGALKQKDAKKSASYGLSFYPYDVLGTEHKSEQDKNKFLLSLGFPKTDDTYIKPGGSLADEFRRFDKDRNDLDYEIDGVVMKADLVSEHVRLGATAHHPRYAIAYKFQGEGAQTTLNDVEWSVGRTGTLTPVAVVDPVLVSGATVTRASLHNYGYLQKLKIKIGAKVEIVRRGGVIPHVERVLSSNGTEPKLPTSFGKLRVEGDFVYVPSDHPEILRRRISHFVKVIDVLGFGEKNIHNIVEHGFVKKMADLYALDLKKLMSIDRMGEKLATKLLTEIGRKRELELPVLLTSLGIHEVGTTVSQTLSEHFPTMKELRAATADDVEAIKGLGPSIAKSLTEGLVEYKDEIDALLEVVTLKAPAPKVVSTHALADKSFVFTGKMAHMERKAAQKKVKDIGGKAPSSVTSDLDFLVIGDDGSPLLGSGAKSTKHKKAEGMIAKGSSVKIISETDFIAMIQ